MKYAPSFEPEYQKLFLNRYLVLLRIAVFTMILYTIYDYFINPLNFFSIALFRFSVVGLVAANHFLVVKKNISPIPTVYLMMGICSWMVTYMAFLASKESAIVGIYNGNLQILICCLGFVPWKDWKQSLIVYLVTASAYYLARSHLPLDWTLLELVTKICFDIFIFVFTYFSNQEFLKSKYEEFKSRNKLSEEIHSREQIIGEQVSKMAAQQKILMEKESEAENSKKLSNLASQVAHDIRSPLTALKMVAGSLATLQEDQRNLVKQAVQRISDISNNLLSFRRNLNTQERSGRLSVLEGIVETVISEKRPLLISKNIELKVHSDSIYPPTFTTLDSTLLANGVSNILQNAIEVSDKNKIEISLKSQDQSVLLKLRDFGPGIPEHVLARLGKETVTFGKEAGNGLGVYNTINKMKESGGNVVYESNMGSGTEVTFKIPISPVPKWIASSLSLANCEKVIVIDDDTSIHGIWTSRFKTQKPLMHFYDLTTAAEWIKTNSIKDCLFLIDFEFAHDKKTGIELIQTYKIQKQSYLVTSRYEEDSVVEACTTSGIRIIPKFLAGAIPLDL